jgi:hypothetical protein
MQWPTTELVLHLFPTLLLLIKRGQHLTPMGKQYLLYTILTPFPPWGVIYKTSFDSKQPKLEPKLALTLSETRCLFRLFRFNIKTTCSGVSIKLKQKKMNRNKPNKRKPVKIFKIHT